MSEPYIGQIILFGGNFAPRGWAQCDGSLIAIAQNTALFSILGTTYGGDGITTFALPDLRGRAPIHYGNGPGLTPRALGEAAGTETVTLTVNQMPAHTHGIAGGTGPNSGPQRAIEVQPTSNRVIDPDEVQPAGGSQPFSIMQPYLAVNFIIALEGIYPSRA